MVEQKLPPLNHLYCFYENVLATREFRDIIGKLPAEKKRRFCLCSRKAKLGGHITNQGLVRGLARYKDCKAYLWYIQRYGSYERLGFQDSKHPERDIRGAGFLGLLLYIEYLSINRD